MIWYQGEVIAPFKIDTLGVVSDIEIIRGVRADLDQESNQSTKVPHLIGSQLDRAIKT